MKTLRLFAIFVFLTVLLSNNFAQTKREVLTNENIIELVKLGLGENIIIEKIRQSECRCNTDTTALAALKSAKVSDAIILAVLNSGKAEVAQTPAVTGNGVENPAMQTSSGKALAQISEPGIYLFENDEMKLIEPSVFSGAKTNMFLGALTYGLKSTKIRAVVRGKSANLQTSKAQPEFYFVFNPEYRNSGAAMAGAFYGYAATSPAEFMMVKMDQKDKTRETVVGEIGAFSGTSGAPDKYVREFNFEKIKTGIYKVTPKINLGDGEYCFYYAASASSGTGKVFDFSVVSKK